MADQSAADLISVPQGGGALAGIGETFQPDPHTGTGNLSVPLPLPPGRAGFQPSLTLAYSTGNPNGPFGLGWALSLPQVRRKTSQGIPRYPPRPIPLGLQDDVFVVSGAEDLVPVASSDGSSRYRPRTESGFARITHVTDSTAGDYWEVWSRDGLRSRYGTPRPAGAGTAWSDPAVIAGPDGIFAWLISETVDLSGNRILYSYQPDPAGKAMRYLSEICYADYVAGDPPTEQFLISVNVLYEPRPDPFSDRRPGFELRSTQRATTIEVWTHPATATLCTSVELTYADQLKMGGRSGVSLLSEISIVGLDGQNTQQLPPLEFGYTSWEPEKRRLQVLAGELPASSLGAPGMDLVDLFGDGRPCILELNGFARYWQNRGDGTFDPPRSLRAVPAGVALGAPGVQLADMDGDGRPDLLVSTGTTTGYWPLQTRPGDGADGQPAGFDPAGYVAARAAPTVSLSDPSVRLIDLDGDGRVDVLRAGQQLTAAYNDGQGSFQQLQVLHPPDGLAEINFSDPRVRLADMTGDGLTDIVLLYRRYVSYWPNLGYGRFGPQVVMSNGPDFEDGAQYDITGCDPRRLLLGDVDGDGSADLVYVGDGHVTVWVNESGNGFADPMMIPGTPRVSDTSAIRLADIDGTGVAGVLWTADTIRQRAPYAFLDLTGGVKPYLLSQVDSHRGATTTIDYSTSTAYAEADGKAGKPWRTTLPFPVQVVSKVTNTDVFSQNTTTTEYAYHHGYWDGADREFRGFARVDQRDAQMFEGDPDLYHSPPTETRTWFHVGPVGPEFGDWQPLDLSDEYWVGDPAMLGRSGFPTPPDTLTRRQQRDACRALHGLSLRSELHALDGSSLPDRPYTVTENQYEVTLVLDPPAVQPPAATGPQLTAIASSQPARAAQTALDATALLPCFPHPVGERTTEWERGNEPRTRLRLTDGYDAYGRAQRTVELAVPRGRDPRQHDDQAAEPYLATVSVVSYATRDDSRYICSREVATGRYELVNDGRQSLVELQQALTGRATLGLRLLAYGHALYDGQPVGSLGDWGLATSNEQLTITMGQLEAAYTLDGIIADPPALPPYLLVGDAVPVDGLRAEYFADTSLTQRALIRPESNIDQHWQGSDPDPVLSPGAFSTRWTGTMNPRYSESYTLTAESDGSVRIWINGAIVLDQSATTSGGSSTPVALTADTPVELKVEFKPNGTDTHLRLWWSSATQTQEPLPQARLAPPPWPTQWGPVYVDPQYPDAFRAALPPAAGYTYHRADSCHFDGYYRTTQRHYDVQDDPTTGRGLLTWQEDALGHRTGVEYDQPFGVLPVKVTDAANLPREASYDYRVLKPNLVTDANGNQTAVTYTPLGLPATIAAMGKPGEQIGDTPDYPGAWFTYGLTAYDDSHAVARQPTWVHTIKRVDHAWTLINAAAQQLGRSLTPQEIAALFPPNEPDASPERFMQRREHTDGFGRLLQARNQADDLVIDNLGLPSDPTAQIGPVAVHQQDPSAPRVVVSGWQAYDNKGRAVEKWEPFFDQAWDYNPPNDTQLTGLLRKVTIYYDPRGLAIRTTYPDGSQQRMVPGIPAGDLTNPDQFTPTAWETYTYDPNDNAGRTDPTGTQGWKDHWNTPSSVLQDALGRTIATTERTRGNQPVMTTSRYDIDGNLLEVIDPLGRSVSRADYDSAKRAWRTELLDAGTTRAVNDPLGGAVEQRDSKDALTLTAYDELHRQIQRWARDRPTDTPTLRETVVYGEKAALPNPAAQNLLGRPYETYDEAGRLRTPTYDLAGNLLEKQRQVLSPQVLLSGIPTPGGSWSNTAYQVDWQPIPGQTLDAHADTVLEPTSYDITTAYDALQRPTTIQAPLDITGQRATLTPTYDRGGGLASIKVNDTTFVERIARNARGQRVLCLRGNSVLTRYAYDPDTFRLVRLRSEPCQAATPAGAGWQQTGTPLQDHAYGYDLVGNLLTQLDTTPGSGVSPQPDRLQRQFAYDPLYRLVSATGREVDLPPPSPPWIDNPPGPDITQVRAYAETYEYDTVGNLLTRHHSAASAAGGYTDAYALAPASNRLQQLTIASTTYGYAYDTCGNMTSETTSRLLEWDHANRFASYRTQPTPTTEPSILTQYRYDASGQRVHKVTRNQGGAIRVTVYIDGLFERLSLTNAGATSEHDTLHVLDSTTRVALLRSGGPAPGDTTPPVLYHLGDHLGSSEVVLDTAGGLVSREEFLPYGETSFGGYAKKRYRFTGKERDEESGLAYHGARYYAPWLARWTSRDPVSPPIPGSPYMYGATRPTVLTDRTGLAPDDDATSGGPGQKPTPTSNANPKASKNVGTAFQTGSYNQLKGIKINGTDPTVREHTIPGAQLESITMNHRTGRADYENHGREYGRDACYLNPAECASAKTHKNGITLSDNQRTALIKDKQALAREGAGPGASLNEDLLLPSIERAKETGTASATAVERAVSQAGNLFALQRLSDTARIVREEGGLGAKLSRAWTAAQPALRQAESLGTEVGHVAGQVIGVLGANQIAAEAYDVRRGQGYDPIAAGGTYVVAFGGAIAGAVLDDAAVAGITALTFTAGTPAYFEKYDGLAGPFAKAFGFGILGW